MTAQLGRASRVHLVKTCTRGGLWEAAATGPLGFSSGAGIAVIPRGRLYPQGWDCPTQAQCLAGASVLLLWECLAGRCRRQDAGVPLVLEEGRAHQPCRTWGRWSWVMRCREVRAWSRRALWGCERAAHTHFLSRYSATLPYVPSL